MSKIGMVGKILRILGIVAATIVATEWVHHRLGPHLDPDASLVDSLSDQGGGDPWDVTETEFENYVKILQAMQGDHGLTVEEAARVEGISLGDFRDLERRVQRNEPLVERTREGLRKHAEEIWDQRSAALSSKTSPQTPPDL